MKNTPEIKTIAVFIDTAICLFEIGEQNKK